MNPLTTALSPGFTPILLYKGLVVCYVSETSQLGSIILGSHENLFMPTKGQDIVYQQALQNFGLAKLNDVWRLSMLLSDEKRRTELYLALSSKSLESLNVSMAIKVARALKKPGMVQSLLKIQHIEDIELLRGHIHVLYGEYAEAEEKFLKSSVPFEHFK